MRNKYIEAMFFMFIILFCSVGFANATEPVVTSDAVVSSTPSNMEVLKSANNTEAPITAFLFTVALKGREDLEESTRKRARHPGLVGPEISWAEFWSLPSDISEYKFGVGKREDRAAHFKSLIKTAGKRHVRRQMRRAAFKANRAHVKKRRAVRASKGEVKTSKGWISRKSFWTSPSNRALKAELKAQKSPNCIQAVIDFKLTMSQAGFTPEGTSRYHDGYGHKNYCAVGCYEHSWDTLFTALNHKPTEEEILDAEGAAQPQALPQPPSVETELPATTEETKSLLTKAVKIVAPAALGLIVSLVIDNDFATAATMITMTFGDYWNMSFDGDDTDYATMREQAEKCLPDNIAIPANATKATKRKLKSLLSTIDKDGIADRDYCHSAMSLITELNIETSIEVEKIETLEEQFNNLIANEDVRQTSAHRENLLNFIDILEEDDESTIQLVGEYLFDLEKKHTYGNPRWKTPAVMLADTSDFSSSLKAQLTYLALEVAKGYRPEKAGNFYIKAGLDEQTKLEGAIRSSMAAEYALTVKVYPSGDRTLKGDSKGHGSIPKIAITADIAWMSGYDALVTQYEDWRKEIKATDESLNVKFGDVIFVQSLKDSKGNEVEIETLNEAIMALGDGYDAVTPGFWVKRGHAFGDWVRDIFVTNKEVRARARSMATTPSQQGLNVDAAGNSTLVVAADLTRNGQPGADGANLVSRNYRLRWNGWIGQLRLHTNYHSIVTKAFQCKGLIRRHNVWAVKVDDSSTMELRWDRDERIAEIQVDESKNETTKTAEIDAIKAEYLPCIVMDVQNIKGRSSGEIKERCASLSRGEALCLNTYSLEGSKHLPNDSSFEEKLQYGRLFGGILAEDYKGKSSTSWQQNQLFSPMVLRSLVQAAGGEFRQDVALKFEALYGRTSRVIETIFAPLPTPEKRTTAMAAAMSQRGMSQRTVEAFVFGMKQKWDTHYCDQIAMPSGWFISANDACREGIHKYLAATGQPQLYHQCILRNKVMNHSDVRRIIKALLEADAIDHEAIMNLNGSQATFLVDFFSFLGDRLIAKFDETKAEILDRLKFVAGSFGRKGEDTLVWISKIDQDKMQRDSDGDRVLFSARARDVKLAKLHNEAIACLPVPSIEVGNVGQDGDETHLAMVEGTWGDMNADYSLRLRANSFVCAPNQGQGPTGQLVNQCSALLNYILWSEENGNWAPDSSIRDAALQAYAFVCLLIQNAIDRTKKPHAVPVLAQCFLLNLYDGVVHSYEIEGGENNNPIGTEKWPSMTWNGGYDISTRNGFVEQYNTPVLKHWLAWVINMINHLPKAALFSQDRKWIETIEEVAEVFWTTTPTKSGDETDDQYVSRMDDCWRKIAGLVGSDDFEETRDTWVFPKDLYKFKDEASLDVPLQKAAPGLEIVSQMVVEENRKAKTKYSLRGNTMKALYQALAEVRAIELGKDSQCWWQNNAWGSDAQLRTFLSMLHGEIKRNRAGERREKGQSELMGNQKLSDTATYLNEMKEAMNTGEWDFPGAKVLDRAFNSKVKHRQASVSSALCMLAYAAHEGYGQWAANNDILMAWAKEAYQGLYEEIIWGPDTEEVEGNAKDEDSTKGSLVRLLSEYYTYSPDFKAEVLCFLRELWTGKKVEADCPYPELYAAGIKSKNHNKDGTAYSAIWSEWVPALEEHLSLAEDADATREYFIDGDAASEAIQYVMDGASAKTGTAKTHEEYMEQCIYPGFKLEVFSSVEAMVTMDLSSYPGASEYRDYIVGLFEAGQITNEDGKMALYGLARKLKLAGDYRYILNMAKPIIQARRLRTWVDQAFPHLTIKKRNSMVREAILNETLVQVKSNDPDNPSGIDYKSYISIKGRPDAVVPTDLQVDLYQGILNKGLSFYALAPTGALWFNFNGNGQLKEGNETGMKLTHKWLMFDSRMRARNNTVYNLVSLKEEFEADLAFGDMFSCAELETWRTVLSADLKNFNNSEEKADQDAIPKVEAMLLLIDKKLKDASEYYAIWEASSSALEPLSLQDALKAKFLYNRMAVPMHWGGNDKSRLSRGGTYTTTTRTSAHRPVWRTIFAVMGDGDFTPEKGDAYNYLTDSQMEWGGKRKNAKVHSSESALSGGFLGNRSNSAGRYDRSNKTSFRGLRPFHPFTTPGVERKTIRGQVTWIKIPRSPMNEFFGSLVFKHDDGTTETAYLDGDDVSVNLSSGAKALEKYILDCRANETDVFNAMRDLCKDSYRDHRVTRVNGIAAGWRVAATVLDDKFDEKLPGATQAHKAELILGCRHITVAWDSYILQKWDVTTQSRMMGKGTSTWKGFMSTVGSTSLNFEVKLPDNALALLNRDLFGND